VYVYNWLRLHLQMLKMKFVSAKSADKEGK